MRTSLVPAAAVFVFASLFAVATDEVSADRFLAGEWQLTTVALGVESSNRLELKSANGEISGRLSQDGDEIPVKGTITGKDIRIEFKQGNQQNTFVGAIADSGMKGTFTMQGRDQALTGTWTAKKARTDHPSAPRTLQFTPAEFHRMLSAKDAPVLTIWPGDTVHTTSVDAGGQDEKSQQRVMGGNPLTGPFYIEGAMPGDVLAVTIKHLRTNRDWAESDDGLVDRALTPDYVSSNKQSLNSTRWHLDPEKHIATLENPSDKLKNFAVPIRPMLGCVGVAPGPGDAPVSTEDSGYLGGNMDYSRIAEGTTVYLRVQQPGALLYLGDAHALQGDGELNGNALETSMDIEFTVNVERDKNIGTPRAEDADYIMAIGLSGSLDDAFRRATSELLSWLRTDYKLTGPEAAIVLGTSAEYNIAEVADRNVGVVAKIKKKTALANIANSQ